MPRRTSPAGPKRPAGSDGGFDAEGGWNPRGKRGDLFWFAVGLVKRRRAEEVSPADLALEIRRSRHAEAFEEVTLRQWALLTDHRDWPFAHKVRSIESFVVYAGSGGAGSWIGGWFGKPPDGHREQRVSAAYMNLRRRLQEIVLTQGLSPAQVADWLESEGLGEVCRDEVRRYRAMGRHWNWLFPVAEQIELEADIPPALA